MLHTIASQASLGAPKTMMKGSVANTTVYTIYSESDYSSIQAMHDDDGELVDGWTGAWSLF